MEPEDSESSLEPDDSNKIWDYLHEYLDRKHAGISDPWATENPEVDQDRDWTDDEDEAYENQFERTKF